MKGYFSFVSKVWTGNVSDRYITERSGLLDKLEERNSVMADKGFNIRDLITRKKVALNIPPPFLGASAQMAAEDVVATKEIASLRVHVERTINKIKNFHMWDRVVRLHQMRILNQMWAVCAFCCNAQPNIISI